MIIIGYPCIGKTTLAKNNVKIIDLESSNFFVDEERLKNWYKMYCNVAVDLSKQKYIVFVSSHKLVIDHLCSLKEKGIITNSDIGCIFPSESLKDCWIDKAYDRWNKSSLDKDRKAYDRIKNFYNADLKYLRDKVENKNNYIDHEILDYKNYSLSCALDNLMAKIMIKKYQ